jgi:sugar phosphate isomerase/epimerase
MLLSCGARLLSPAHPLGSVRLQARPDRTGGRHSAGRVLFHVLFMKDLYAWEAQGQSLAGLRRELASREAPISCLDPYLGWYPGFDPTTVGGERAAYVRASKEDVFRFADAVAALSVNLVAPYGSGDVPHASVVESLGRFADRSAAAGLRLQLEVVPTSRIRDLQAAVELVTDVGRSNVGLLADTYNLARGGVEPRELDQIPRALIFAMQIADGPAAVPAGGYGFESLHCRLQPGMGELNVGLYLDRMARHGTLPPLGPEVFDDRLSELPALTAAGICGRATRYLLATVELIR